MSPNFWDHFWTDLADYLLAVWPIALALAVVILVADWWWRRRSGDRLQRARVARPPTWQR